MTRGMGQGREEFDFVMIKPSHYDDDGYPIVWWARTWLSERLPPRAVL